jgi:hypothetical protein
MVSRRMPEELHDGLKVQVHPWKAKAPVKWCLQADRFSNDCRREAVI